VVTTLLKTEALGCGPGNEVGIANRRQRHEADTMRELRSDCAGDFLGEVNLADASGAEKGHHANRVPIEEAQDLTCLVLAAKDRCERRSQTGMRSRRERR